MRGMSGADLGVHGERGKAMDHGTVLGAQAKFRREDFLDFTLATATLATLR